MHHKRTYMYVYIGIFHATIFETYKKDCLWDFVLNKGITFN